MIIPSLQGTKLTLKRPFRAPHYTISESGLIGGGDIPKPGEISLAHYGVLFLDELPEFKKDALEVMRGPLEDGVVTISRVNATLTYPCDFIFVASMNLFPVLVLLNMLLPLITYSVPLLNKAPKFSNIHKDWFILE